jgi:hypothetical protein
LRHIHLTRGSIGGHQPGRDHCDLTLNPRPVCLWKRLGGGNNVPTSGTWSQGSISGVARHHLPGISVVEDLCEETCIRGAAHVSIHLFHKRKAMCHDDPRQSQYPRRAFGFDPGPCPGPAGLPSPGTASNHATATAGSRRGSLQKAKTG